MLNHKGILMGKRMKDAIDTSANDEKKGFAGRRALREVLAEASPKRERDPLGTITGAYIPTTYPARDERAEKEISELLGVPMTIRAMRLSKKRSELELEEGFREE